MNNPRVLMSPMAHQKIRNYITIADGERKAKGTEVSGLGLVEHNPETNTFMVTDTFLVDQTVSSSSTEINDEAMSKLLVELDKKGVNLELLRYHWHLHPGTMSLFWSGTDEKLISNLAAGQWSVATVFDTSMNQRTRVTVYSPVYMSWDKADFNVLDHDFGLMDSCREEFQRKEQFVVKDLSFGRKVSHDPFVGDGLWAETEFFKKETVRDIVDEALALGGYPELEDYDSYLMEDPDDYVVSEATGYRDGGKAEGPADHGDWGGSHRLIYGSLAGEDGVPEDNSPGQGHGGGS